MHISFDLPTEVKVAMIAICFEQKRDQNHLPKVSKNDAIFLTLCCLLAVSFDKRNFPKTVKKKKTV